LVNLKIKYNNILNSKAQAIVNPANTSLLAGSGLCGVIHKHAGRELELHCKSLGHIKEGEVAITPSFGLTSFNHIIHAAGPRYINGKHHEAEKLTMVHFNIVKTCVEHGIESVAIPAISTGIYRYPVTEAAQIAITTLSQSTEHLEADIDLEIVLNDKSMYQVFQNALTEYSQGK
jgi:O-acetyl-ADP-ribose deacetylase (regulator of RNase III)